MLTQIPQLTGRPDYRTDTTLDYLQDLVGRYVENYKLDMDPDFQRGHVWNQDQQRKFVEFLLKGGKAQDILLNHPNWMGSFAGHFTVVDGKQRLTACLEFLKGNVAVFPSKEKPEGWTADQIEPNLIRAAKIGVAINSLKTRKELLKWYLELNENHIAHQPEELAKVRGLLEAASHPESFVKPNLPLDIS